MSRRRQEAPPAPPIAGRLPPHDSEVEAAVLSACLLREGAVDEVADLLSETSWYVPAHRLVWGAMEYLTRAGEAVDVVSVAARLRADGGLERCGGALYLAKLVDGLWTIGAVRELAARVAELAELRRRLGRLHELLAAGYGAAADPRAWFDALEAELVDGSVRPVESTLTTAKAELTAIMQALVAGTSEPALSTGLRALDEQLTGGFRSSDLVIVAGRPGMGKTQLGLGLCRAAESAGMSTITFSLEQPESQIAQRHFASVSGVDLRRIRSGAVRDTEWPALTQAGAVIGGMELAIDKRATVTPAEIASTVRRFASQQKRAGRPLGLVVVDYLQLMNETGHDNREQEIASCSRQMKRLAKGVGVPVVVLSQLNRDVEKRKDKRPQISDLRESGAVEQDADVILFPFRPGYYAEQDGRRDESEGESEIIVGKQRNGPTGCVRVRFWSACGRFTDLEDDGRAEAAE